jgi:hypothetical protein
LRIGAEMAVIQLISKRGLFFMKLGALSVGILVVGLALVGCGGGSKPTTPQCTLNSDCAKLSTPGLVCALGYCVKPCNDSTDCPNNERCVTVTVTVTGDAGVDGGASNGGADSGVAQGTACQAPETVTCQYTSQCKMPLVCGIDQQCRDQCQADIDCPGGAAGTQVCTVNTHLCADPAIDKDYDPTTRDFKVTSGGGGGAGNGGASGSGNGGHSGNGGSGAGGTAGGGVNACPSPQTSFGNIAQGDSNAAFTSGVGVRDGNQLFIFSAEVTPPSDAGAGGSSGGNYIYVQAFDSATGNSKGPAAPLFKTADGPTFGVYDVSVAPSGEIAVLHSRATVGNGSQSQLYASFLSSPTSTPDAGAAGPDAGVDGLKVVQTVQLESVPLGEPHVIWSVSNAAFVISWKYATSAWFTRVRKFMPDGRSAGGDTSVVPTRTGSNNDSNTGDGQVGISGKLTGAAYRDNANALPYLTILDTDGLQVGDLLQLSTSGVGWVSVGGTTSGFVSLFNINGSTVNGVFVPTSGTGDVLTDGGVTVDAGDAGIASHFTNFSLTSDAIAGKMVSDDTGGLGGVGAVLLESNGASFIYVTANGSKHMASGTIISSAHGAEVGLSNYRGSFALSLYDSTTHATQVVASGCSQ